MIRKDQSKRRRVARKIKGILQKEKQKMKKKVAQDALSIEKECLSLLQKADHAIEEVAVLTGAASALTGEPLLGNIASVASDAHKMLSDLERIDEDLVEGKSTKDDLKNMAQDAAGMAVCFVVKEVGDVSSIVVDVRNTVDDLKHGDIGAAFQDTTDALKSATDLTGNTMAKEATFIISAATTVVRYSQKKIKQRKERKAQEQRTDKSL